MPPGAVCLYFPLVLRRALRPPYILPTLMFAGPSHSEIDLGPERTGEWHGKFVNSLDNSNSAMPSAGRPWFFTVPKLRLLALMAAEEGFFSKFRYLVVSTVVDGRAFVVSGCMASRNAQSLLAFTSTFHSTLLLLSK